MHFYIKHILYQDALLIEKTTTKIFSVHVCFKLFICFAHTCSSKPIPDACKKFLYCLNRKLCRSVVVVLLNIFSKKFAHFAVVFDIQGHKLQDVRS